MKSQIADRKKPLTSPRSGPREEIPPPAGTPPKGQFFALVEVMERMAAFDAPADRVLSSVFRAKRELGQKDRAKLADLAYTWLRNYASFAVRFPSKNPLRWAIAMFHTTGALSRAAASFHGSKGDAAWLDERMDAQREGRMPPLTPAQAHECPEWLWARLVAQRGEANTSALMKALSAGAPFDLRVNTLKAKRDDVLKQMQSENLPASAMPLAANGIRLPKPFALQQHPLFESGALEVQDEGSQLLAQLVGAKRGEMVADFCAGAGGKTLALGAAMSSTGRLYAMDVEDFRLKKMSPRLSRAGVTNVQPMLIDSENDARLKKLSGKFDRVLVDAPCSGLGTLRRNPDLKWRQTPAAVEEMNAKQLSILIGAARLVKGGGRLVYATCSILREENEAIVEAFLKRGGFRLIPSALLLNVAGIDGDMLNVDPVTQGCDGFFAAVLERIA